MRDRCGKFPRVRATGLDTRASCHTFRYSFATRLPERGDNIGPSRSSYVEDRLVSERLDRAALKAIGARKAMPALVVQIRDYILSLRSKPEREFEAIA